MPANGRTIKDFFKPFTIPKSRRPTEEEDEIVVAASPRKAQTTQPRDERAGAGKQQQHVSLPKRGPGRPRKDGTASPSASRLVPMRSGHSTPTRQSPRRHVNITGDADSISLQSSQRSTPSTTRTLQAVELPSPMNSISPPPQPTMQPPKNVNTSFSSFSTLSSAPLSSQSSSRRIVKNGIPAVTNSDSASMSSSSEDELMDIDAFAPRKKRKVTPPAAHEAARNSASKAPDTGKPSRASLRLSNDNRKKRESWQPPTPPPTVTYKHSLAKMVKQNARQAAVDARIAEAEASIREAEMRRELQEKMEVDQDMDGKSLAAAAFAGDSDEGERMMMAMERTEALRGEEKFFFFRGNTKELPVESPSPLQSRYLESYGLSFLKDPPRARLACNTGFLATVASQKGLPGLVTTWIQQSLLSEEPEELCEAYVAVLNAMVRGGHQISDPMFSPSEFYAGRTLSDADETASGGRNKPAQPLPRNLKYVLKSIAALAPAITAEEQACALAELVLLNIDENIRQDVELQIVLERAMDAILASDNDEEFDSVCRDTIRQVLQAPLPSRALLARTATSLPAPSLRLHQLRRKLALHILLEASADEKIDMASPSTSVRLLSQLKRHRDFNITENTNYTTLISLTELIDIAIDSGFSDFHHKPIPKTPDSSADPVLHPSKGIFTSNPPAPSESESAFNAQIDALVAQLRAMASTIRDAGTSHLKRTEAKSALERLVVRLESSVRTRPKPRRGVFGVSGRSREAMVAFLEKAGRVDGVEEEKVRKRRVGFVKDVGTGRPVNEMGMIEGVEGGAEDGDISVIDENKFSWQKDAIREDREAGQEMDTQAGADGDAQM